MSGMVCPSCGVAVTPGYVRCPKCRKPLPRRATTNVAQGGTAVVERKSPWKAIAIVVVALVVVGGVWQGRKAFEDYRTRVSHVRDGGEVTVAPAGEPTATPTASSARPAPAPLPPLGAAGPTPQALAGELDRSLKHAHLWSTVEIIGDHVDVRSESCGDPAIQAPLSGASGGFKAAGLTRLRCLDQSGTVVFQRDL